MNPDRSIRAMTAEEKQAKRDWGTGACQVRGCTARAGYLAMESAPGEFEGEEWWQYCCAKHATRFANRHGLEMPAPAARNSRVAALQ
jgi:hypothetical protein